MLDLKQTLDTDKNSRSDVSVADRNSGLKIDADPNTMRLFVRGKRHQIEQVKSIIAGMEVNSTVPVAGQPRLIPLAGELGRSALQSAAKFWRGTSPIDGPTIGDDAPRIILPKP